MMSHTSADYVRTRPSTYSDGIHFRANMTCLDTVVKTRYCSQHSSPFVHPLTGGLRGKSRKHTQVRRPYTATSDLQNYCIGSHIAIRRAKAEDAKDIAQICSKVLDVALGMYKMQHSTRCIVRSGLCSRLIISESF